MSEAATRTVLVVDDNAQNRALAEATLVDEGYRVILATTGEEGLRAFEAESPDCVLLDVRMPGLDGLAVCGKIRSLPQGAHTPILFLTAQRDLDTFDSAIRAGADDFLTKPVRPIELVMRIRAALKLGRLSSERGEHLQMIRQQRDDLMRLQLLKERLMTFVVHDLKNPVANIDMYAQMVLLRGDELPATTRKRVQGIRGEVQSLLLLITNLLDLSKGDEARLTPKISEIDLRALVTSACSALDTRASANGVHLASDIEVGVGRGDVDLLRRVLENLLDNAIHHAPDGSTVSVSVREQDGAVELRVADAGRGIAPELREQIFDRFFRAQKSEEPLTRSGRGLGLAFCKLAVEAHNGRIWVEDACPGAIFCVSLPHVQ